MSRHKISHKAWLRKKTIESAKSHKDPMPVEEQVLKDERVLKLRQKRLQQEKEIRLAKETKEKQVKEQEEEEQQQWEKKLAQLRIKRDQETKELIIEINKRHKEEEQKQRLEYENDYVSFICKPRGVSVTKRVSQMKQPKGGYVHPKSFICLDLTSGRPLLEPENIPPSIVGTTVDYMTRWLDCKSIEDIFISSFEGASAINEGDKAFDLADSISGVDDKSIIACCRLSAYEAISRTQYRISQGVEEILPDAATINSIRIMISRAQTWREKYGPIVGDGFKVFGGDDTRYIAQGEGDFLTADTLWDFKVSKSDLKTRYTLQVLVYYLMGKHSREAKFEGIKRLGIVNPRLDKVYLKEISKISEEVITQVEKKVIGYGAPYRGWSPEEYRLL
ncbi:hypothetical protein PT279_05745 [Bifidobacterium sp. ESL0784]|uniref:hypothetical protein n=1 Tax=Bifidobacterium sp. ESL0784 TaxID=2983231 RepID=UPI0023F85F6C|nr:hypothetical protein [Bifidobacterium sp. ESL0784]MDF7641091.1 hypothetical protein [Bifidobacterium sp. ESL0784]